MMVTDQKIDFFCKPFNNAQLITLVGMMGAGKSKFGYTVAKSLNFNFYDSDNLIEKQFNNSIKNIFESHGEPYFRKIEKEKIKKVVNTAIQSSENAIISLGGGAFDNQYTRNLLLEKTRVIWLNVPMKILIKRVGDGVKRPMIRGNIKKSISEILNKREKYYSLSHHQVNTNNLSQEQITTKIIEFVSTES
ncbi:shikimate kinase [Alphaproteobacteria bacterium]|nr:shikimate kinase [Alphaproteobacteria bacterium]